MITSVSIADEVRSRGFARLPNVISSEQVVHFTTLLERCIQEDLMRYGDDSPDRWMVLNLMARHIDFALLMENQLLQGQLAELLGDTCIVYAYTSSSMPPNDGNYSCRIHVDCPRMIPGYITNVGVMLALTDYTDENGATWYLPGSFERPDTPTRDEFLATAECVYPRAGDAIIFNARTFHMGGQNRTGEPRHALTMNVCRSYMRQRFDYPRLVPQDIVDRLSDVGKRFLGFNVRMPASLEEYYVPEERRLYKANQG